MNMPWLWLWNRLLRLRPPKPPVPQSSTPQRICMLPQVPNRLRPSPLNAEWLPKHLPASPLHLPAPPLPLPRSPSLRLVPDQWLDPCDGNRLRKSCPCPLVSRAMSPMVIRTRIWMRVQRNVGARPRVASMAMSFAPRLARLLGL